MLMNRQYVCKLASYWPNLVKGDMTATEAKYHKNFLKNMYNKFRVKRKKNAAVEKELLSTIEDIYTQLSILYVHKMLWIENQPVFTIAYTGDLKLSKNFVPFVRVCRRYALSI